MRSAPDAASPRIAHFNTLQDIPAAARFLFGGDFFSSFGWYEATLAAAIGRRETPVFVLVSLADGPAAIFPMKLCAGRGFSLTTPYSCAWRPLIAPGLPEDGIDAVWRGFSAWCRRHATVRLDALDERAMTEIAAGMRASGFLSPAALPFEHFGNWHIHAPGGAAAYFAARPGHVREAIRRRGRQLAQSGGTFAIIRDAREVEAGTAAYESVYAKSWKEPEPFPAFNATLMRACAASGSLRLGLLHRGGAVLAAQFWVVQNNWAAVLKLAHDEAARALSPGTLLTAHVIEHLLTQDGVTELDFGRGDDPYKQSWADMRRQRFGLVLANPRRAAGLASWLRHTASRAIRRKTG